MTVDIRTGAEETQEAPRRDMEALIQQEVATRPERIQRLSAQVDELFQGEALEPLREDIKQRSFNTPQYGEFHTEGFFMDTHIERILATIDGIEAGNFHPQVPENFRPQMQQIVAENKHTLQMYAYLHDIEEPADQIASKLAKECKISKYDKAKLSTSLQALVTTGQINASLVAPILDAIDDTTGQADKDKMKAARKPLGKANSLVQAVLQDSEIR